MDYYQDSNPIHLIHLWVSSEKTPVEILVFCHLLYYILLHYFALLLFLSLMHLVDVKFWPQSNELCDDLSTNFIFHHSHHSLIAVTWNARTVIYRVVTCIKPLKSPFISLKKSSVLISQQRLSISVKRSFAQSPYFGLM